MAFIYSLQHQFNVGVGIDYVLWIKDELYIWAYLPLCDVSLNENGDYFKS